MYALNNAAPAGVPIYLSDGFSPAEKFLALSGGFGRAHREVGADTAGTDVSQVVSTRLPRLAPGDSATVTFAVLAAPRWPSCKPPPRPPPPPTSRCWRWLVSQPPPGGRYSLILAMTCCK
ncbi:MAG: hypothetical protein WKG07_32370 [Hymenobacter sp.]